MNPRMSEMILASDVAASCPFFGSNQEFIKAAPVAELEQVIVTRKGSMILSIDKEPIFEASNESIFWQPSCMDLRLSGAELAREIRIRKERMRANAAAIDTNKLVRISGQEFEAIYLMHSFGWYAYGHLFDTLQRLFSIEAPHKFMRKLIISDATRVTDFVGHLEMLGYDAGQLISVPQQADGFLLDRLRVPQSPAIATQFTDQTMKWIRKCYLENNSYRRFVHRFSKYFPDSSSGFALFLDRSSVGSRNISNIDEILAVLRGNFSQVIRFTGSESVHEMLFLFSNAKLIVGAHGAMFVNTVFASPKARILEFCPNTRRCENMVRMCKPSLDHYFIPSEADSSGCITIDIPTLAAMLD